MKPHHPWIARFTVAIVMLLLAFVGLVLTNVKASGGWSYWQWTVGIYAVTALWLSWYLRRSKSSLSPVTLWHELLHWIGLVGSVFLITFFVEQGLLGRIEASLSVLSLLSLGVFLAGIYIETWFIYIGIVLGLFATIIAFIEEYLYAFTIPLLLLAAGVIGVLIWHKHKHANDQEGG